MTRYLCDVNIWLTLAMIEHAQHRRSRAWLESIGAGDTLLFCRATQHAFVRLISTAAVMAPYQRAPLTSEEAWTVYDTFLRDDRVSMVVTEPEGLEVTWRRYSSRPSASPKLWMDAYLAAFARRGGYRMVTTDRAFRQFEGLDLLVLGEDAET